MLSQDLSSADKEVRRQALELIASTQQTLPAPITQRVEVMARSDKSSDVRFFARRAMDALEKVAAAGGALPQVTASLRDEDPKARLKAVQDIRLRKDRGQAGALIEQLGTEKDPWVLSALSAGIGELGEKDHGALIEPLLDHADHRVCANTVLALSRLKYEVPEAKLTALLTREDNRVRGNAILALKERDAGHAKDLILAMLDSPHASHRSSALFCARQLDVVQMAPPIQEKMAKEEDPAVFQDYLRWVQELSPDPGLPAFLEQLIPAKPKMAKQIQATLAEIREARAVASAVPVVTEENQSPARLAMIVAAVFLVLLIIIVLRR